MSRNTVITVQRPRRNCRRPMRRNDSNTNNGSNRIDAQPKHLFIK